MGNSVIKLQKPRKPLEHGFIKRLNLKLRVLKFAAERCAASPVKVELDYSFDGDAINAKGCISVSFHENCARCNNEFNALYCDFEERFFSSDYKGDEYPIISRMRIRSPSFIAIP